MDIQSVQMMSVTRHLFQFVAGVLVAKGYMSGESVEYFVGGFASLIVLGWMHFRPAKAK